MMTRKPQPMTVEPTLKRRLIALAAYVDALHNAAADDQLHLALATTRQDLIGWLGDLVYTLDETICELENHQQPDVLYPDFQRTVPVNRLRKRPSGQRPGSL